MQQQERSKMLGTMPMNKLVPKVAVPIMISMLVQALYNVVDGIFVARYSADAFTAVSLVFPVQMLMIAVSTGLGVGINSLISRRLGEKRGVAALDAAKNGIFLELCGVALFCLFGLFLSKVYMHLFTDDCKSWARSTCSSSRCSAWGFSCRWCLSACCRPPATPRCPWPRSCWARLSISSWTPS